MRVSHFGRWTMAVLSALLVVISPSRAQSEKPKGLDRLQSHVAELALSFPGTIGVYARNIETGAEISFKSAEKSPWPASTKFPSWCRSFAR